MLCPNCKTQVYWMYYYGWSCNCEYVITYSNNSGAIAREKSKTKRE